MKNKCFIIVLFLLCILAVRAQSKYMSVTVNEDSTLTFRYCGPGKKVSVQSDLLYADENPDCYTDRTRRIKMDREWDGCYYATTRPVSPETYTYCFCVNGKRKPDPLNADTAWQKMHKWNVVNVGGSTQADLYRQPDKKGQLIRTAWYSTKEKLHRRVNIYLPAGYESGGTFPVLYLIHGINGYEGSWAERGRAIHIIENLVAEGQCQPMILVMPDVNFGVHEDKPSHHTLWNNVINYPRLCHDHNIGKALVELIHMTDTTYRVSDERYIAGLSDGARIAANTANMLPGYFGAIGMFSPVVHKKQMPQDNIAVYIYTGKKDMFHANAKRFYRRLEKKQTTRVYMETTGGHTWRNWRIYLSDFLRHLHQ